MKVENKVYILGTESGNKISPTDNLLVVINDIPTRIHLRSLFESYNQGTSSVEGHSFLSDSPIEDGRIMISPDMAISIINKNTDESIYFTQLKDLMVQWEKESFRDSKIVLLEEEWKKLQPPVENEETTEIETSLETEAKEEVEEEESEVSYEDFATKLKSEGFKEYNSGKYALLFNPATQRGGVYDKDGNKMSVEKIRQDNGVKVFKIEGEEEETSFDTN